MKDKTTIVMNGGKKVDLTSHLLNSLVFECVQPKLNCGFIKVFEHVLFEHVFTSNFNV